MAINCGFFPDKTSNMPFLPKKISAFVPSRNGLFRHGQVASFAE